MDADDIISLKDEVQEFLIDWKSGCDEDLGSPEKLVDIKVDSTDANTLVVDEEVVERSGTIAVRATSSLDDNNAYTEVHGVHDGEISTASDSDIFCSDITLGEQLGSDCGGVKRLRTFSKPPVGFKFKSYVEEMKARWPSKYKKLKKDLQDTKENK